MNICSLFTAMITFYTSVRRNICSTALRGSFLQPHATGLWHRGQKLYFRISFSTAQCLHTLHIQNWYSWMGRPVTMHMGNFPSELKARMRKAHRSSSVLAPELKKKSKRNSRPPLNAPFRGSPALQRAAVLGRIAAEDLQGQVLVELPLPSIQTLQGLQLDEGLRTRAERPVDRGTEGQQGVDLHHGDDVLVLSQVQNFFQGMKKAWLYKFQ